MNGAEMPQVLGFDATTRRLIQRLNPVTFTPSTPVSIDIPQVGFAAGLVLRFAGTLTTAGGGSATVRPYPSGAHGIANRVRVTTSEGNDVYNTSGQGLYLVNRHLRTGFDPFTNTPSQGIAGVPNAHTAWWNTPVSLGATQTQTWLGTYYLPLSWTMANLQGLLLTQNLGAQFTLTIEWGDLPQLYSATVGATLSAVTCRPTLIFFALPDDEINFPDLRFIHSWIERRRPLDGSEFAYRPKLGNIFLRSIQEFINPVGGADLPIAPASFDERRYRFAQTQNVEVIHAADQMFLNRLNYGLDLPPGVLTWEWQMGNGILEQGNTRDAVDTSLITDMSLETNISTAVTINAGAFVRCIDEQLQETEG